MKLLAGAALLALLLALSLSLPAGTVNRALAQDAPTPTPNDPLWRAFAAVREAIAKEKSADLGIVKNYDWEQSQWQNGIDDCRAEVNPVDYREVYWGWTFTITSLTNQTYQGRVSFDLKAVAVCDQVVSAAAPTAAAGTPNPNLPTPIPGSAATGSFELGGHVLSLSSGTVALMNRAGMKWAKSQLAYNLGDDPSKAASIIASAKSNGLKLLLGIKGDKTQISDSYINTFAQFLDGVAAQGVDAIEVWNEPNIDREWQAGQINGGNYTKMLAAAYNAIKAKNPNTIVISGAPAPTGYFGAAGCTAQGCNDDVFMQQMAAAGAAQYLDCVGLHYNEGVIAPSATSGDPRGSYPSYFFGSMLQRGYGQFGGKPVCFSELGYLSPQGFSTGLPANFAWAQNTTVAQHAAWLAEAATIAAQSGKVRLMIVWNVDFPFYTADDPMGGYAMFRPDGSCPACDTLGAVMKK
ncbi:MAG TPA: hypothetical protein VHO69_04585 [Phototrophicaceae bacterium]|nr:hypothetical protein [Phototrophicaceae bacterium]